MAEEIRLSLQTLKVLRAILEAPSAEWYGRELAGAAGLRSGTMYPILARLEGAGWLQSRWESVDPAVEGRPRRRLYRFTATGQPAARAAVQESVAELALRPERPARRPLPGQARA